MEQSFLLISMRQEVIFLNRVGNCPYMFSTPLLTSVALIAEEMSLKTDCLVRVR